MLNAASVRSRSSTTTSVTETLDERVTDAAIDGSDEIQPVRRQSRRQVGHVDDASTPQTARSRVRRNHLRDTT